MPSLPANRQRLCSYSPNSSLSAASLLLKPWDEDHGGPLQICLVSHAAHIKLLRSQEPYVMRGPPVSLGLWIMPQAYLQTCPSPPKEEADGASVISSVKWGLKLHFPYLSLRGLLGCSRHLMNVRALSSFKICKGPVHTCTF